MTLPGDGGGVVKVSQWALGLLVAILIAASGVLVTALLKIGSASEDLRQVHQGVEQIEQRLGRIEGQLNWQGNRLTALETVLPTSTSRASPWPGLQLRPAPQAAGMGP